MIFHLSQCIIIRCLFFHICIYINKGSKIDKKKKKVREERRSTLLISLFHRNEVYHLQYLLSFNYILFFIYLFTKVYRYPNKKRKTNKDIPYDNEYICFTIYVKKSAIRRVIIKQIFGNSNTLDKLAWITIYFIYMYIFYFYTLYFIFL